MAASQQTLLQMTNDHKAIQALIEKRDPKYKNSSQFHELSWKDIFFYYTIFKV